VEDSLGCREPISSDVGFGHGKIREVPVGTPILFADTGLVVMPRRDLLWLGLLIGRDKGLPVDHVSNGVLRLDGLAIDHIRLVLPFGNRGLQGVFQILRPDFRSGQGFDRSILADEDGNVKVPRKGMPPG